MAPGMRRMKRGERKMEEIQKGTSRTMGLFMRTLTVSALLFLPFHGLDNRLLAPQDLLAAVIKTEIAVL